MYGLPKDFDASFLIGQTLEMICFNSTQLYLHLSSDIKIVIESAFLYDHQRQHSAVQNLPVSQANFIGLLTHKIIKANGNEQGDLMLEFDNSQIFVCLNTSKQFESYQVHYGNSVIIV